MLGSFQGLSPSPHQQPMQQAQQQQQQQQGQHVQGQPGQQQQQQQQQQQPQIPLPPTQNGQDITLSSVLHFLQTEWRRYERDRNEWEIERAEMRVSAVIVVGLAGILHLYALPMFFFSLLSLPLCIYDNISRLVLLSSRASDGRLRMSSWT
jgi:deoxyribodipyrimidine photolyase